MEQPDHNIEIYIGSQIEYESEKAALLNILETLNAKKISAIIIANTNIGKRQIDIILATENILLIIEAKKEHRPIRGGDNGNWEYKTAAGDWRTLGRNYYRQALDGKNTLRDEMKKFSGTEVAYPEAALIFMPSVPSGSVILESDFKVKIGGAELIDSLDNYKKNNSWSFGQWRKFSEHQNLIKLENVSSAFDEALLSNELLLSEYNKAFTEAYKNHVAEMASFVCHTNNCDISTDEMPQLSNTQSMAIIGPSGCGKSVLAKKMSLHGIENGKIPLFIEAKYFENEFGFLLNKEITLFGVPSASSFFAACRRLNKPLLLVIDGFNECPKDMRMRLSRCIKAVSERHKTEIIITTQRVFEELDFLNSEKVQVSYPSYELKKKIAIINSEGKQIDALNDLIHAAKSNLEAKIIGKISDALSNELSRYSIFDYYIRSILEEKSTDGIDILSRIAKYLLDNVTFNMSVREFDRIFESNSTKNNIQTKLISSNILNISRDRLSFGHELYLNIFSAEAVLRTSKNNPDEILHAISLPKHKNHRTLIIGAINNVKLLDQVLEKITDGEIIFSCMMDECGKYAKDFFFNKYKSLLENLKKEANTIQFKIDETSSWWNISADTKSIFNWSLNEICLINTLPKLIIKGSYLNEIFEVVGVMDENLRQTHSKLREEAISKKISLRSGLFYNGFVDQNSKIGISKIIACLDIHFNSGRDQHSKIISEWVKPKLHDTISDGQLLMLLKLCRLTSEERPLTTAHLANFINTKWKYAPYHLRLDLLDTTRYCSDCNETDNEIIVDALSKIDTSNIWISSMVLDALKSLNAIEDMGYEETVKHEIKQALSQPENPDNWALARSIYNCQFDHPYDHIYYEILHALPDDERKQLLTLAVRAKDDFRMFVSCMITDLATFGDRESGKYLEHWTELPPKKNSMPQEAISAYVSANIVLGYLQYKLPTAVYDKEKFDNAILACGQLYYWLSRSDLNWEERKIQFDSALLELSKHELGVSIGTLKECEEALRFGMHSFFKNKSFEISIVKSFSKEISEICRYALKSKIPQYFRSDFRNENEILNYAVGILGRFGTPTDISILHGITDHDYLGTGAITAIHEIENRHQI